MLKRILTLLAALAVCAAASAQLSLRQPCSDGMVLQQQTAALPLTPFELAVE